MHNHLLPLSFSLLIILAVAAEEDHVIHQVDSNAATDEDHRHFVLFKKRFGKAYNTSEHEYRFRKFKENMVLAKRHQMMDPAAEHGITPFSDLTLSEFHRQHLGLKSGLRLPVDAKQAPILSTADLPERFDWRDHGAVTAVKNQDRCLSCWSFSATGALEGAVYVATAKLYSLSEQQLLDCDHECDPKHVDACDVGCQGGFMNNAFEYAMKAGGLMSEEEYPYTATDGGICQFDKAKVVARVSNFSVVSNDEDQIVANLVKNGPLAVAINSAYMQTYVRGVSCPDTCSEIIDHGVLVVGYVKGRSPKSYWIIKNSWGPNWSEKGFYRICSGRNLCGVESMVTTVAATRVGPVTRQASQAVGARSVWGALFLIIMNILYF